MHMSFPVDRVIQQFVPVLILLLLSLCDPEANPQLQYQISAPQSCPSCVLFPEDDLLFIIFRRYLPSMNNLCQCLTVLSAIIFFPNTLSSIYIFSLGDSYNLIQNEIAYFYSIRS